MKLLIVESPNKISSIESVLGESWKVVASYGHVRDLPEHEMGVESPSFRPTYVPNEKGEKNIALIANLAKKADEVYLATDPDREGESIAWHIKEACGLTSPKRVKFNELTHSHIQARVNAPGVINNKLVLAQEARRVDDRFTGYLVSPAISKIHGSPLSAGRVQSSGLRLVAERELDIKHFKPTDHFGVTVDFGRWEAEWRTGAFITEDQPYVLNKSLASQVAAIERYAVTNYEEKTSKRQPPAPFTTSTMQQAASVTLKMRTKETMDTAQNLFAKHLITYHRTDYPNLASEAISNIFSYCKENGLPAADKPRTWKAKQSAQEAHEAIRPTDFNLTEAGDTPQEKALYKLIWQRAVASQMAEAKYAVRIAELRADHLVEGKPIILDAKGKALLEPGWLSLTKGDQAEEETEDKELDNPIPRLVSGGSLTGSGKVVPKKTKSPARYTDASLVKALEERGIGRPATYAAIITTLFDRKYMVADANFRISCTDLGMYVYRLLMDKFSFMDFDYTARMEDQLDLIAEGQSKYVDFVRVSYETLQKEVADFLKNTKPRFPCPTCGRAMSRIVPSESGKKPFWGCSGYPDDCTTILPDDNGKPGAKKMPELSEFTCKSCNKPLIRRKKVGVGKNKGYDFYACSGYPKCDVSYPTKAGKPDYAAPKNKIKN